MSYRNKTYIAFDGDKDMHYYRLMTAWKSHDGNSFNFHNAHDLNSARDTSLEQSIKKQLRERFSNSKLFIILIGENTKNLHKFVRWEIEVALSLGLPIIAVNLNSSRRSDERCPAILRNELAIFVTFNPKIIEYAMANWPDSYNQHKRDGVSGSRYYFDRVYSEFGL
ncbi:MULTISPECIES: TIR domain-containing protein [Aurantimonas]|uniref:TIR domain-containing protein n=1 Tax=Aurantimonas TaxID=182269 RepID=UPI0035187705